MDLNRVSDEEKLKLCKRYFLGGFFLLPLLWLVNIVWFFPHAFLRAQYSEQKQIRYYVSGSLMGLVAYTIPIVAWIAYFQTNRADWPAWSRPISFMTPAGRL